MKLGILTGGGDVPPLNIVIDTLRKRIVKSGDELIGFVNGWEGVVKQNCITLNDYNNFSNIGGTFLKSSRINLLTEEKSLVFSVNAKRSLNACPDTTKTILLLPP